MCKITTGTFNGMPFIAWSCSGDPDQRLMEAASEFPEDTESMFRTLVKGDQNKRAKHLSLRDISSDGKVYLRKS